MAALAKVLLFSAVGIAASSGKPPGFPCALSPVVLESKLDPPNNQAAWPANCLGLNSQGDTKSSAAACKAACTSHQSCSVWQLTPDDYCYIADDYDQAYSCISRANAPAFQAKAGQRLQHGKVNVTQNFASTTWYEGLNKVGLTSGAEDIQAKRCKNQCYSDIYCQYWLFVKGTATPKADGTAVEGKEKGCYVQTKVSQIGSVGTLPAGQTSEGQMIAHQCPAPTPAPKEEESNLWMWLLLIALLLLLLLAAALIFCLLCQPAKTEKKKTRAVKVAPKKQPEVLQPLVPMPIVQQPMVTYATPTITTAVATPTYQAVPQVAPRPMVASTAAVPMVPSVAAAPLVTTAAGGSVVMPAAGGSVVMPAAGGSVAMEQPRVL